MNKKRTNYVVTILNIIIVLSFYILAFSKNYIMSSIITGDDIVGKSIYNNFIIDTLINNIQIITTLMYIGTGLLNIICAIQNKDSKKICFWQLVLGFYCIWSAITINSFLINYDIIIWGNIIILGIIPIIFAIINLILINKNKPKLIKILSYIAVIILAILSILEIIGSYWDIIAVVMQLIYVRLQDKDIVESNSRKNVNLILYYILQSICAISFFAIIITALIITKVNDNTYEKEVSELYNNIIALPGFKDNKIYIPVEKDNKYGFIDESGQEKIPLEYDRVSYFNEIQINNNELYVALAKKDNKFYIISKNNDEVPINGNLNNYLQTAYEYFDNKMTEIFNTNIDYRSLYLQTFDVYVQILLRENIVDQQILESSELNNQITLNQIQSKYYCNNQNYSMMIEPVYDETEDIQDVEGTEDIEDIEDTEEDNYSDEYYEEEDINDEIQYYDEDEEFLVEDSKYNVTITKSNGETEASIVYLPGFDEYEKTIDTFTNGYIEFEAEDSTQIGWYDSNGNKILMSNDYEIEDIKDNKIILQSDNYITSQLEFVIMDMEGKELIRTTALDIYDSMYLIKNEENKMVLLDKDLKTISKEYDKIITNMQIDSDYNFSSYLN